MVDAVIHIYSPRFLVGFLGDWSVWGLCGDSPADTEQIIDSLGTLEGLLDRSQHVVCFISKSITLASLGILFLLDSLFPLSSLLLVAQLLHWVIGLAGELSMLLAFCLILPDIGVFFRLAVLNTPLQNLFLLVVIPRNIPFEEYRHFQTEINS